MKTHVLRSRYLLIITLGLFLPFAFPLAFSQAVAVANPIVSSDSLTPNQIPNGSHLNAFLANQSNQANKLSLNRANSLLTATPTPPPECPARQACNSDFEQGLSFWNGTANATITAGRNGQGVEVSYDGNNSDIYQRLPGIFEGGKSYQASVWCKADVGEKCQIFFGDSRSGYEHALSQSVEGNGEWQQVRAAIKFSKDEEMTLHLYSQRAGSSVIYDDVKVEEVLCGGDLICNAGFEQEWAFWRSSQNATLTTGRSGQGIQLHHDGNNSDIYQPLLTILEAGKSYQATVWCKADVGEQCHIFFGDSGSGYENALSKTLPGNGEWQQLSVSITLTKDEEMRLYLYARKDGSSVIYDEVEVKERSTTPEPVTPTLTPSAYPEPPTPTNTPQGYPYPEPPTPTKTPTPPTNTISIPLVPGWNLISIPVETTNPAIDEVLASIAGHYDLVYAYDGCNAVEPWSKYDPSNPPFANTLSNINKKSGLWVHMTSAATLVVTGTRPEKTPIALCTGWNLTSYSSARTQAVGDVLGSINPAYTLVYGYDAANSSWKKFDPNNPPFANDLQEMRPGKGYWIEVKQNVDWMINN